MLLVFPTVSEEDIIKVMSTFPHDFTSGHDIIISVHDVRFIIVRTIIVDVQRHLIQYLTLPIGQEVNDHSQLDI